MGSPTKGQLKRAGDEFKSFTSDDSYRDSFCVQSLILDSSTATVTAEVRSIADDSIWTQVACFANGQYQLRGPLCISRNGEPVLFESSDWSPAMRMPAVFLTLIVN